jgi:hypothetical protein
MYRKTHLLRTSANVLIFAVSNRPAWPCSEAVLPRDTVATGEGQCPTKRKRCETFRHACSARLENTRRFDTLCKILLHFARSWSLLQHQMVRQCANRNYIDSAITFSRSAVQTLSHTHTHTQEKRSRKRSCIEKQMAMTST